MYSVVSPAASFDDPSFASPTRMTMPVSPTWFDPPTTLTWSPILKNLTRSSAGKESASASAAWRGITVTVDCDARADAA